MNLAEPSATVKFVWTIIGFIFFAYMGWYYFFQPRSFQRAMDHAERVSPRFARSLRSIAKPSGIISFLIAALLLAMTVVRLVF